jgi:putative DNA primase/helicase
VAPAGPATWRALCPAHEDRKPSLSIAEGRDGAVLLKCHAGCSTESIVNALDLSMRDLFPPSANGHTSRTNGKPRQTYRTAAAAVKAMETHRGKRSGWWTYRNAAGVPVGVVVRWDRADGKDIRPVARHADGWRIGAMPDPRPLYGLPDLAAAPRVVICEGEKAAESGPVPGIHGDDIGRWFTGGREGRLAAPGRQGSMDHARQRRARPQLR